MITPQEMIDQLSGNYFRKVEKLMTPLKTLGIDYYCLQTVSNEGRWSLLGNRPDWLEYSADEKFYMHDPSIINPMHYKTSGYLFAEAHKNVDFENTLLRASVEKFGFSHTLAIIEKSTNDVEFVFFSAHSDKQNILNIYLNNLTFLKQFTAYFKRECKMELAEMKEVTVDMNIFKGEAFQATDNVLDVPARNFLFDIPLTGREKECLLHTVKGLTAKQIAKLLKISPRTVEAHLENIRKKYGLKQKRDFHRLLEEYYP